MSSTDGWLDPSDPNYTPYHDESLFGFPTESDEEDTKDNEEDKEDPEGK